MDSLKCMNDGEDYSTSVELCPRAYLSSLNFLPNNQILDWTKLKALADDKIHLTQKSKFSLMW